MLVSCRPTESGIGIADITLTECGARLCNKHAGCHLCNTVYTVLIGDCSVYPVYTVLIVDCSVYNRIHWVNRHCGNSQ